MLDNDDRTAPRRVLTPAEIALQVRFGDAAWHAGSGRLVWLEQRSGRGVVVAWDPASRARTDLTASVSVRSSWGYGGGDFGLGRDDVFVVSGGDVYRQNLHHPRTDRLAADLVEATAPTPSPDGGSVLLISHSGSKDILQLLPVDGSAATTVQHTCDFLMQPAWSPDGKQLCWVGWNHPNMPWDGTGLYLAASAPRPEARLVRGKPDGDTSLFQPTFSPDGRFLSIVCDDTGWFNLVVMTNDARETTRFAEDAEHAPPAWIQGLRSTVWSADSRSIFLVRSRAGSDSLVRFEPASGTSTEIATAGWTALAQPSVAPDGRLSLVASAPERPTSIISLDPRSGSIDIVRSSLPQLERPSYHESPAPLAWGPSGDECFGLFYQPTGPASRPPPVLLRAHGGPTSHYRAEFEPDVAFFCSRGIAVLDVNYRGSSGYGRAYRSRLDGRWGDLDVADLCSAAEFLAATGRGDPGRLIAAGGSAGGLTVLMALATRPGLFAAGICRYAVSDLLPLVRETHRFERCYLDRLVGRLPEDKALYRERSPLRLAGQIGDPVAIFQGGTDRVVPQQQTESLVDALLENGVPHTYRLYPEEGHGWRKAETIADYYDTVDQFLRRHRLI